MAYESKLTSAVVTSSTERPPAGYASGYISRDFKNDPVGFRTPAFSGRMFPESDWDELARLQEVNQSSPLHAHKGNVGIMSQGSLPYCWCYGVCAGVATQYAKTGIDVPEFSPTSTAAQIKNFRKEGGWGSEACEGLQRYGLATTSTWANCSLDRSLPTNREVIADSHLHNVVEFEDLGENQFNAMISTLLDPVDSAPCSVGFNWWGHLVVALQAVKVDGGWGIVIANSWGTSWGDDGYGTLLGYKAVPDESIRIGRIKPRA